MDTQGNGTTQQSDTPQTPEAPHTPDAPSQSTRETGTQEDQKRKDHPPPAHDASPRQETPTQETPAQETPAAEAHARAQESHAPQRQKTPAERAMDRGKFMFDTASGQAGPVFTSALGNAASALGQVAANPVGNLPRVRAALSVQQALGVSVVFVVVAAVGLTIGVHLIFDSVLGFGYDLSFGTVVQLFGAALASFVSLGVLLLAARKLFSHAGDYGDDAFVASMALLPVALAVLVTGLVGLSHYQVAGALGVFAACYVVLILYTGCVRLAEMPEAAAAPLAPLILILSAWLSRVLFRAIA